MTYDVIVRNGLWFDGTGAPPRVRSLGIRDGIVDLGINDSTDWQIAPISEVDIYRAVTLFKEYPIPDTVYLLSPTFLMISSQDSQCDHQRGARSNDPNP